MDTRRDPTYGAGRAAVVAVVGGAILVVVLVAWAASIGAGRVIDNPEAGRAIGTLTPSPTDIVPTGVPTQAASSGAHAETPLLVKILATVLVVGLCLLVLALLGLAARHLWSLRIRRPVAAPADVGFELLASPARVQDAMVADAAEQRRLLLGGNPRNGIVACWDRFETQAAAAGAPRRHWETSSEYTLRLLDLVAADDGAVTGLATLFREARFSRHEVTEADRERAVAALDRIHASLLERPLAGPR